ncbi:hypothetical protein Dimus_005033 [Dionaea muscipula]
MNFGGGQKWERETESRWVSTLPSTVLDLPLLTAVADGFPSDHCRPAGSSSVHGWAMQEKVAANSLGGQGTEGGGWPSCWESMRGWRKEKDGLVADGSPAYSAGIRRNDVITQCNQQVVHGFLEFSEIVWNKASERLELSVMRASDGTSLKLYMDVLETSPDNFHR